MQVFCIFKIKWSLSLQSLAFKNSEWSWSGAEWRQQSDATNFIFHAKEEIQTFIYISLSVESLYEYNMLLLKCICGNMLFTFDLTQIDPLSMKINVRDDFHVFVPSDLDFLPFNSISLHQLFMPGILSLTKFEVLRVSNLGLALAVKHNCNCPPSASEVIRYTCAIQIRLLLLLLLLLLEQCVAHGEIGHFCVLWFPKVR